MTLEIKAYSVQADALSEEQLNAISTSVKGNVPDQYNDLGKLYNLILSNGGSVTNLNDLKLNIVSQDPISENQKGILFSIIENEEQKLFFLKEDGTKIDLTSNINILDENKFLIGDSNNQAVQKTPLQVREILNVQEFLEDREINSVLNNFTPNTNVVDVTDNDTILTAIQKIAAWKSSGVISSSKTRSLTGLIPTMGISGQSQGFAVSASSYYGNQVAYHWFQMFDNSDTTQWVTNEANPTIFIDLPSKNNIWKMELQGRNSSNEIPRTANLYGSNNKVDWYLIGSERDMSSNETVYDSLIDFNEAYQYFKLEVLTKLGTNIGLRKFQLYEIS